MTRSAPGVNKVSLLLLKVCILGALLAAVAASPAFAQAGSAGGTIGKQNKSISGGEEQPARPKSVSRPRRAPAASAKASSGGGVSGRWHWQAQCQQTFYQGEFEIGAVTDGHFTGQFFSDVAGPISAGEIEGSRISFMRSVFGFGQPWHGTFSGSQMSGGISGALGDICTFKASR